MDQGTTAQRIIDGVGGAANIVGVDHCMTRLRLTLTDTTKVDAHAIQAVPGVQGTLVRGGQFQIVLGSAVATVSDAIAAKLAAPAQAAAAPAAAAAPRPATAAAGGGYADLAAKIVAHVGGTDNVSLFEHCSTRLRFTLIDKSKAKIDALKATPGVLGVVDTLQTQVIIGNAVGEVFRAIQAAFPTIGAGGAETAAPAQKAGIGAVLIDFIIGVFQPLVPAIAGAGMLKAMLSLFAYLGWIAASSPTYKVLNAVPDGVFYFLGFMVAVTTANKMKVDRLVAIAAVAPLLLPSLNAMVAQGTSVFGVGITAVPYNAQVFPPVLTVLFLTLNWRFWSRVIPKPIRIFAVPMMSLLVTVPVSLTVLGPAGFIVGTYLTTGVLWLHAHVGWPAVAALAMALPFLVALGMHKPFVPYMIAQLGAGHPDPFYLAASLAHNIAESGAAFAVALRTKNPEIRATGISAGTSAFFGITEPALYGLTLQNKPVLWSVLGGCGVAGVYVGFVQLNAFVAVGPGLASMATFMDPNNGGNIINAFIGFGIAFAVSFGLALVLWRDPVKAETAPAAAPAPAAMPAPLALGVARDLVAPMSGAIVPLAEVGDAAFAQRMLGDGIAIRPDDGAVRAPADGVVDAVEGHALTLTTEDGVTLLIHVGIDTVRLKGRFFTAHVQVGDRVRVGQLLLEADLAGIRGAGFDTTTVVIGRNAGRCTPHQVAGAKVSIGDRLAAISAAQPLPA